MSTVSASSSSSVTWPPCFCEGAVREMSALSASTMRQTHLNLLSQEDPLVPLDGLVQEEYDRSSVVLSKDAPPGHRARGVRES